MNNYIDYNYYENTFAGKLIPGDVFNKCATIASGKVRNSIFNRDISLFEKEIKTATCLVAEIIYNQYLNKEKIKNIVQGVEKQITSEKIGDYSRNLSNVSVDDLIKLSSNDYVNNHINEVIEDCLLSTGLMYCGGF